MKSQLINETIKAFIKRTNKNSKWFAQDLADFTAAIKREPESKLKQRLSNWSAMDNENSSFNKEIRKEEKRMLKAGMFNVGNLKPENCLD